MIILRFNTFLFIVNQTGSGILWRCIHLDDSWNRLQMTCKCIGFWRLVVRIPLSFLKSVVNIIGIQHNLILNLMRSMFKHGFHFVNLLQFVHVCLDVRGNVWISGRAGLFRFILIRHLIIIHWHHTSHNILHLLLLLLSFTWLLEVIGH